MGDLSAHFSKWEFRCHCGQCGMSRVHPDLIAGLEQLREHAGFVVGHECSVAVNSGVRCVRHNHRVGGSPRSQHVIDSGNGIFCGHAADIVVARCDVATVYTLAQNVEQFRNGGIGVYPEDGFIHVDVRGHAARWGRVNGYYTGPDAAIRLAK